LQFCGLGHAHPVIAEAIAEQAATLIHTSNLFEVPWQTAAAQKLAEVAGMEEVFFSNSGAESNEGAIKIARKFGYMQGIAHPKLLLQNTLSMGVPGNVISNRQQKSPRRLRPIG
jgi:acetylornithine aminotransferase